LANLRKIVATDLIHGLLRQNNVGEVTETSADRIAALGVSGAGNPLGALLWHLRWANDHRSFEPAVAELSKLLTTRRAGNDQRTQQEICRIALEEWLDDVCRTCGGRGYTIKGVKHACSKCNATGTRRHSDAERMRRLGIDKRVYRKVEVRFAEAHTRIADADYQTARTVSRQLRD
jgi:hypothetical protein